MRINDKIREIEDYLSELEEIMPKNFHEYKTDLKTKAACERYFEKIIEAVIDLAFLIIKDKGYKLPEEDKEAFDILTQEKIISQGLAIKFKEAKGMRNIIAHDYGKIDDEIIFEAIDTELEKDSNQFLDSIMKEVK